MSSVCISPGDFCTGMAVVTAKYEAGRGRGQGGQTERGYHYHYLHPVTPSMRTSAVTMVMEVMPHVWLVEPINAAP
ncbi:hypothetical protein SKAU_G00269330 [Synaphobranchus kaupii]|uniref:Uncharacterized protein n=1 Tax=Synaphobranchus kaupii TaxID=118154 RepID=A0A9Q1IQE6_SYNKA|nr:hypothetical protein SKAU_G00269330 [Synaphobranchus kaupii]